jgi:hypothetical protein
MDRLVRARILLAEAAALGVTIDDLIAEASSDAPGTPSTGPTVAEYVDTVMASFSKGTADTYKSYWRLLIDRLGERPIGSVGVDDCEAVVVDAVERARRNRPETNGRSSREPPIDVKSYLWGVSGVETAGESIRSHWGAHSYQATRFE